MNKAVVIGTGLIGGSFMLGLRDVYPNCLLKGMDKNEESATKAQDLGVIDAVASKEDIKDADLVVISIPVDATIQILNEVLDAVSEDTLVLDMGSTKEMICKNIAEHPKRRQFMAAHPIAGTEFSGPEAAVKGLFKNKIMIVCEIDKTAGHLQERAKQIFDSMEMSVRYMTAAAHDKHIAYVSHLSHISSFMLGKTVIEEEKNERDIFDLAGSGFASTVRLAKSSPAMWAPIFAQNKNHVLASLDEYIENLSRFRESVKNNDQEAIFKDLEQTNRIKTILKGINNGK